MCKDVFPLAGWLGRLYKEAMKTIYLCDDEASVRDGVCQYLKLEGYEARGFETLSETQHAISTCEPDLLVQEVTLPDGNGFSFVKKLKASYSFPIVFLTARASESDRIIGFELGADDYIVKPFSPKELVLRVQAVLRRVNMAKHMPPAMDEELYTDQNGNLMMFSAKRHVLEINGTEVQLTAAEWRILEYLISTDGQLENRAQMIQNCFDYSNDGYEGIINTHIKNLRSKITGSWIETVRGYGYRFLGVRNKDARNKAE